MKYHLKKKTLIFKADEYPGRNCGDWSMGDNFPNEKDIQGMQI